MKKIKFVYQTDMRLKYIQLLQVILLIFCPFLIVNAQIGTIFDDFEGNGTHSTWTADNCLMDINFQNPHMESINTSPTVLRYMDVGGQYANIQLHVAPNFVMSDQYTFSLKIYVPSDGLTGSENNQISLKLQNGSQDSPWMTQCEVIKPIILDQWQEISFDFLNDEYINFNSNSLPPTMRTDLNRILLQVNGENNYSHVTAYVDDLSYDGVLGNQYPPSSYNYTELVWSDEFDTDGPVNPLKWHHQTILPNGWGWFNDEVQHYTDEITNSYVENGELNIVAIKENYTDQGHTKPYTSARLNSKFAFTYGRVEVRAKLPQGEGTWPAIWMLGKNINENGGYWQPEFGNTGWPACGEIDIMEHWGYNENFVQSAMHTPSSSGATENKGGVYLFDAFNDFHTYELEWNPSQMRFSVDGFTYYVYQPNNQNSSTWPFTADQFLLLNIAMVGNIDPDFEQSSMVLDYVRVYQEDTNVGIEEIKESDWFVYPNPVIEVLTVEVSKKMVGERLLVTNSIGQPIKTMRITEPKVEIDMSEFSQGKYYVSIVGFESLRAVEVIKQ